MEGQLDGRDVGSAECVVSTFGAEMTSTVVSNSTSSLVRAVTFNCVAAALRAVVMFPDVKLALSICDRELYVSVALAVDDSD